MGAGWRGSGVAQAIFHGLNVDALLRILLNTLANLFDGVEHRGVVSPPKVLTDFSERTVGEPSAQVHTDLAWKNDGTSPPWRVQLLR